MAFSKNTYRIKILLLLCLFIGFQYRATTLTHIHIVNNHIIAHTHPYSDNPETPHTHTLREFSALDIKVSNFFYLSHPVDIPGLLFPVLYKILIPEYLKEKDAYYLLRHFRGPPSPERSINSL